MTFTFIFNDPIANGILYLFGNIFRIYIIYRFIRVTSGESRCSLPWLFCAYSGFFVLNSIGELWLSLPYLNLAVNIICLVLLTWLQNIGWKDRLFLTAKICIINLLCEALVYSFWHGVSVHQMKSTPIEISSNILMLLVFLLLEKREKRRKGEYVDISVWIAAIFIPLFSIFSVSGLYFSLIPPIFSVGIAVGFLILNIGVFRLYDALSKAYQEASEKQILEQQILAYSNRFRLEKQMRDRVERIHHDMKNFLEHLLYLAKEKKTAEIAAYIAQIQNEIRLPDQNVQSGNPDVDGILNFKLQEAEEAGLSMDVQVIMPTEIGIASIDLTSILGNLLDNAIEAAKTSSEKKLKVQILYDRHVLLVSVENSYSGSIRFCSDGLLTTKKEPGKHGIGLKSARQAAEKYDGILKINHTDSTFQVDVVLYEDEKLEKNLEK